MNLLQEIKNRFEPVLAEYADGESMPMLLAMIRPSQDARFGDYQANCAMPLGKKNGQDTPVFAAGLIEKTDLQGLLGDAQVAGPGFINITLDDQLLIDGLAKSFADLERLGVQPVESPRKFVIDFSSPNVAKPMHVGHIRSTVIGDSLSRVLAFIGHNVITDNHLGDWGTQFGMIIYGYKHFLNESAYQDQPVAELSRLYRMVRGFVDYHAAVKKLPESEALLEKQRTLLAEFEGTDPGDDKKLAKKLKKDIKSLKSKMASLQDNIKSGLKKTIAEVESNKEQLEYASKHPEIGTAVLNETARLHEGDETNQQLWTEFMKHGQVEIQRVYDRLKIEFDHVLGESFYHDQLGKVVEDLQSKKLAEESEGALCVFMDEKAAPMIVRKSDGAFLYATTDLATVKYRMDEWQPDAILYVVDFRQGEHFDKLFEVARKWGYPNVEYQHVKFGTVMGDDGKPFKTRSGDTVGLEPLLDEAEKRALAVVSEQDANKPTGPEFDEQQLKQIAKVVGIGALKYADLSQNRTSDYTFSYDKMVELKGNTATYLQYGYARVQGIFRRGEVDVNELRANPVPFQFSHEVERQLALKLLRFSEALDDVAADYRPNQLANYLFELTQTFFVFFDKCPVLKSEGALKQSRLQFCDLMARTVQMGLSLMGIETLDRM